MTVENSKLTLWGFIKGLFKVIIGLSLFLQSMLFLIILLAFTGLLISVNEQMAGDNPAAMAEVPDGAALVLNPNGVLVEQAAEVDPFDEALREAYGASTPSEQSVHDIVAVIDKAADDERIKLLVLDLGGLIVPSIYASKMDLVADAVDRFKESGKEVVAVGDFYSQEQYYIASRADKILMNDQGNLFIIGYGSYRTYYKELLEKLKITSHVFRVGKYKSALEPVLRNDMSPEAKQANLEFLGVLWRNYVDSVEQARGLNQGDVAAYVNNMPELIKAAGGDMAKAAVDAGLIDELMARQDQIDYITDIVGKDEDDKSFLQISYKGYLTTVEESEDREEVPNVAVITAAGTIIDGDQPVGVAGGDTIARMLKKAREDEDIKAVVLRVDSPGGSAFASEIIRSEVLKLKEAEKPVVISMGSLAASGGYWISANADEIWAAPTTVTGSIGIFGYMQTFENAAQWAGVYTDGVGTTQMAPIMGAGIGALPENFAEVIQASIENGYERFLAIVSEGRGMERDAVHEIAQGRVWIGEKALELGLVDKLGTLDDAVLAAATLAGIEEDFDQVTVEETKTRFEKFIENLQGASMRAGLIKFEQTPLFASADSFVGQSSIERVVRGLEAQIEFENSFNDPMAMYVRCLECSPR